MANFFDSIEVAPGVHDGLSYLLKIKLATDFGKLSDVRIIARNKQSEQKVLEQSIKE